MAIRIVADTPEELVGFAVALAGAVLGDGLVSTDEASDSDGVPSCVVMREEDEEEPERLTLSPDFPDLDDSNVYDAITMLVNAARDCGGGE